MGLCRMKMLLVVILAKVLSEHAFGCFGTSQLERGIRFPMPPLERTTRFRAFSTESRQAYSPAYFKHSFILLLAKYNYDASHFAMA